MVVQSKTSGNEGGRSQYSGNCAFRSASKNKHVEEKHWISPTLETQKFGRARKRANKKSREEMIQLLELLRAQRKQPPKKSSAHLHLNMFH